MADKLGRQDLALDAGLSRHDTSGDARARRFQELGNIGFYEGVGGADSAQRRPSIANLLTTSDDRARAAAAAAASHAGGPPLRPGSYSYPYYGYAPYQMQAQGAAGGPGGPDGSAPGGPGGPGKDAGKLDGDKGDPAAQGGAGAAGQFQNFPPVYGYYPQPGAGNYPSYYYAPNVYQQGGAAGGAGAAQAAQQAGAGQQQPGGAQGYGSAGAAGAGAAGYPRGGFYQGGGYADPSAGAPGGPQPGQDMGGAPDKQEEKKDGEKGKKRKSGGAGGAASAGAGTAGAPVGGVQTSVVSADRPYPCPFEGCHWSFARLSDQRRHLRSHQKPTFHCPYWHSDPTCHRNGGAFNRLDVLKRHLRLVHFVQFKQSESGWCRVCQKMFPTPKHFVDHCEKCAQNARPAEWKVDSSRMMAGQGGPGGPPGVGGPDKQLGPDGQPQADDTLLSMAEVDVELKDKDTQAKGGRGRTRNAGLSRQTLSNSIQAGHHLSQA